MIMIDCKKTEVSAIRNAVVESSSLSLCYCHIKKVWIKCIMDNKKPVRGTKIEHIYSFVLEVREMLDGHEIKAFMVYYEQHPC